jgi:hypothetical protein
MIAKAFLKIIYSLEAKNFKFNQQEQQTILP